MMKRVYLHILFIATGIALCSQRMTADISTFTNLNALDHGAVADGAFDNTEVLQHLIDQCHLEGGGTILLGKGVFLSGTLILKSNVSICINKGAELRAYPDVSKFKHMKIGYRSRMDTSDWRAFLFAEDQKNISIYGGGTINGLGHNHEVFPHVKNNDPDRPYCIHFVNCEHVTVKDLYLKNSAFWMQRYLYCNHVRLENLNIWNHSNQNNDGFTIDSSQNVTISNCVIDSSDDGITIKSEGEEPAKNITISNCIVGTHASAIKFGTGSVGGFENIVINNCVVRRSESLNNIHYFKSWGGLVGIDLSTVDGGPMRNIVISNIAIDGVETPIFMRLGNRLSGSVARQGHGGESGGIDPAEKGPNAARINRKGTINGVTITNVTARNAGPIASVISGYQGNPIKNLTLRDITIICSKPGEESDLMSKPRWDPGIYPVNRSVAAGHHLPVYGLIVRHTEDTLIENVRLIAAQDEVRPAFLEEHNVNLQTHRLMGRKM